MIVIHWGFETTTGSAINITNNIVDRGNCGCYIENNPTSYEDVFPLNQTANLPTETEIRNALYRVIDPEVGINVIDLGLVYGITIEPNKVHVEMTMTTPACPMGGMIMENARRAIADIAPESVEVTIRLVWDPPWSSDLMTEEAKEHFGWS